MKILHSLVFILFIALAYGQNVGIGTASPGTKLDVNGAITLRETQVGISSNAATIPSNASQVRLTGTATATITLTAPAAPANAGQRLVIYNNTSGGYGATYAGTTIPDGIALEFIYTNNTWVATVPSGTSVSSITSASPLTANSAATGAVTVNLTGIVPVANGGTGISTAGSTGFPYVSGGTWSVVSAASALSTLGGEPSSSISGSSGYHAKFTGANTLANGVVYDNGSSIGVGNTNPYQTVTITNPSGVYTNSETSNVGLGIETGQTANTDWILYMGADKTNKLSFIQSVNWGCCVGPLMLNGRGGNVGIGTSTAPGYQLTLSGAGSVGVFGVDNAQWFAAKNTSGSYDNYLWPRWSDNIMYLNYGSGGFNIRNNSSTPTMFMTNGGAVGIGNTSPGYPLDVTGNIHTSGNIYLGTGIIYSQLRTNFYLALQNDRNLVLYDNGGAVWASGTSTSDIRTKDHIVPLEDMLPTIMQLSAIRFQYKKELDLGNEAHIGVIAQEIMKYFPDMVYHDAKTDRYLVYYDKLTTILLKGMQEQQCEIEELKNDNAALRSGKADADDVGQLKKQVKELKQQLEQNNLQSEIDKLKASVEALQQMTGAKAER